jgi:hypothetical protein
MISKLELQSVIEKYHLNGLIESVKWTVNKNKQLTINFTAPSRELIGTVVHNNFPLPESEIGINDTTQLDKLISITSGDLVLDYVKDRTILTKLLISDNQFHLNYSLADILTVPKVGKYTGDENYNIETILNDDIIGALIKAKNALSNSESVVITPGLLGLEFIFGGDVEYANKVSYSIQNLENNSGTRFELVYNSVLLKEVLVANKDMESGSIHVNGNGLMKLSFNHKTFTSIYYIVAKEQ